MPRPPRLLYEDARYHVTCRGNARQTIFLSDRDRERFLEQLEDSVRTCGIELFAFILMSNHYHLLVKTPRGNLPQFMQRLNTSYSLYFRYKHGRPGHLFQSRYGAKTVAGETYLLALTRYIHLNPVKTQSTSQSSGSEIKKRLNAYRWSSYPGYVQDAMAKDWINYEILQHYGSTLKDARRRYRAYTEAMATKQDEDMIAALQASRYAIGDSEFIARTEEQLSNWRQTQPLHKDIDLPFKTVPLEEIDAAVSRFYHVPTEELKRHGRVIGIAKSIALELAARMSGKTQRELGRHYGGISSQAVSMARKKLRTRDPQTLKTADEIAKSIKQYLQFTA